MSWTTASQMAEGSNWSQNVGVHPDPKVAAKVAEDLVREAEAPVEVGAGDLTAGLALQPQVNPGPSREAGQDHREQFYVTEIFVFSFRQPITFYHLA